VVARPPDREPGEGSTGLDVSEEVDARLRVVAVRGVLDLETAGGLRAPLARAAADPGRALVVDLTECGFVDSVGLATLLQGAKPLQNGESNVAFVAPDGPVRTLLRLTAVDRTVPVFATRDEASAAVLDPG
jgi:anti-sigma B factor antagonist